MTAAELTADNADFLNALNSDEDDYAPLADDGLVREVNFGGRPVEPFESGVNVVDADGDPDAQVADVGSWGRQTGDGDVGADYPCEPVDLVAGLLDPVDPLASGSGFVTDLGLQQPAVKERYNRKVAIAFTGGAAALVVAAVLGAMVFYSGEPKPPARAVSVVDPVASPVSASPTVAPPSPSNDRPLPYTADAAGSCLPEAGSTAAQTMSGEDPYAAFVCARGGADGQVINIDLGKTYAVTAISLTPGWIGPDRSGTKQWGQHRVVTTVQYLFNDTNATLVTQETKNVHGEAVQPIRPPALASRVQMLIRQTSRPPIEPESAPTSSPGPLGVLSPPPAFGGFGDGNRNTDPVDATFAISSLKIIGYDPLEHP